MTKKRGRAAELARMEAELTAITDQVAEEMGDWFEDGPRPPGEVVSLEAWRTAKGSSQYGRSEVGDGRV